LAQEIQKRLEARRLEYATILQEDEKLLAENGLFTLLTSGRFIQLSTFGKVKNSILLSDIEKLSTTRARFATAGPLIIHTSAGSTENFGILSDADWEIFQEVFAKAKVALADAKTVFVEKNEPKEKKPKPPKTVVVNQKRLDELEENKKYGTVTAEGVFSFTKITVYSLGFVKVGSMFGGGSIQKLLDIFGESDITKKTGLGRAATAILTFGINLTLLPNQRGNVYLTISTPSKTHSLMLEMPRESDLRLMNKLVSAGKAAISRRDSDSREGRAPILRAESGGVDQSLQNLVKLHKDGLIDDAEYKAAKAKLLGL
jgi:hypothetical protein